MYGVSLPYKELLKGTAPGIAAAGGDAGLCAFLRGLCEDGVASVELRGIGRSPAPADMLAVCRLIWACELSVTIHGAVRSADTAVSDVFDPLALLLPELTAHQPLLTVTVHPVCGNDTADVTESNIRMVGALAGHILENGLPVRIALENNRRMPDGSMGDSVKLAADVISRVRARLYGDPRVGETFRSGVNCVVGICFDMGHYAWYREQTHPGEAYEVPSADFMRYVIHTHIHAVSPGGQTHFPLAGDNRLPLASNLDALGWRYGGVLDLELSFERFRDLWTPEDALRMSLDALRAACVPMMEAYADIRAHYVERLVSASSLLRDAPGKGTRFSPVYSRFSLVYSTFYIFDTAGTKWVMDPVLRQAADMTDAPDHIADCLAGADYILITHSHDDHFERSVVRRLAGAGIQWVIPSFMVDMAKAYGLSDAEIIPAEAGQTLKLGTLTVQTFEGRHYRPGTKNGVPELGYLVTAPGSPSMLFPGDIRDYDPAGFPPLSADIVFAHVWLGDGKCMETDFPLADSFVRLFTSFGARRVLLTHLYETVRDIRSMWQRCHAELLAERMKEVCPDMTVDIPDCGTIIQL